MAFVHIDECKNMRKFTGYFFDNKIFQISNFWCGKMLKTFKLLKTFVQFDEKICLSSKSVENFSTFKTSKICDFWVEFKSFPQVFNKIVLKTKI